MGPLGPGLLGILEGALNPHHRYPDRKGWSFFLEKDSECPDAQWEYLYIHLTRKIPSFVGKSASPIEHLGVEQPSFYLHFKNGCRMDGMSTTKQATSHVNQIFWLRVLVEVA